LRLLLGACLGTVVAAASHQAGVALGLLDLGSAPGDGPPADGIVGVGIIAVFAAAVLGGVAAGLALATERRDRVAGLLLALANLAAAAFVVGRFFAYDPYYLPTLRRFSDGGNVGGAWIAFVLAVLLATAATARRPTVVAALSAPALFLAAVTVVLTGVGH
jgi:hypothetical protein